MRTLHLEYSNEDGLRLLVLLAQALRRVIPRKTQLKPRIVVATAVQMLVLLLVLSGLAWIKWIGYQRLSVTSLNAVDRQLHRPY